MTRIKALLSPSLMTRSRAADMTNMSWSLQKHRTGRSIAFFDVDLPRQDVMRGHRDGSALSHVPPGGGPIAVEPLQHGEMPHPEMRSSRSRGRRGECQASVLVEEATNGRQRPPEGASIPTLIHSAAVAAGSERR